MALLFHVNILFNSISYRFDSCLIDPGDVWSEFCNTNCILLTHAHFDHIYGLNELMKTSPDALVYTNDIGREMLLNAKKNMSYYHETPFVFEYPDLVKVVNDGDEIDIGNGVLAKAVFTPGHNPSCITWVIDGMVFTGDSYIPDIKTVINLPGSNKQQAMESEKLILKLAKNRVIYPGHAVHEYPIDALPTNLVNC